VYFINAKKPPPTYAEDYPWPVGNRYPAFCPARLYARDRKNLAPRRPNLPATTRVSRNEEAIREVSGVGESINVDDLQKKWGLTRLLVRANL